MFKFTRVGTPSDNLIIQIVDIANPSVVIASGTILNSALPSGNAKTNVTTTLSSPGLLGSSAATYHCRLTRSGVRDTANYFRIWGYEANVKGNTARLTCANGTWTQAASYDVRFQSWALVSGGSWVYALTAYPNPDIGTFDTTDSPSGQVAVLQIMR
jgi:hypothetical protein